MTSDPASGWTLGKLFNIFEHQFPHLKIEAKTLPCRITVSIKATVVKMHISKMYTVEQTFDYYNSYYSTNIY